MQIRPNNHIWLDTLLYFFNQDHSKSNYYDQAPINGEIEICKIIEYFKITCYLNSTLIETTLVYSLEAGSTRRRAVCALVRDHVVLKVFYSHGSMVVEIHL